jgi:hypothetical protein
MSTISQPHPHSLSRRTIERLRPHAPEIAFAAVLVLAALIVMVETRRLSLFLDDWDFVLDRRGLSAHVLLTPHNPHLSLLPILVYKTLLAVFGAGSYVPFRLLAAFDFVLLAGTLGWVCRSLWGRWWGVAPVLLLVTLGAGGITTLWSFQVGYAVAASSGMVALVAAGRDGRRAEVTCCAALIVSLASASLGVGFLVGAAVIGAFREDRWRRSWTVLVPLALYGLWYLGYGHQYSQTDLSLWKNALPYSMQALAATLGAVAGLSSLSALGTLDITFGVPIALAAVAGVAVAIWRGWRPSPMFWGAAATLIVLFVAACISNDKGYRGPNQPRYLSTNAAILFIAICAAIPRPRPARAGAILACLALAVVSLTNAPQYGIQRDFMYKSAVASRADLGGLLILRGTVGPSFTPTPAHDLLLGFVRAKPFYDAVDSFGLKADSPAELQREVEGAREEADRVLRRGGVAFARGASRGGSAGRCAVVGATPATFRARVGTYRLTAARAPMRVTGARFADAFTAYIGSLAPSTSAGITIRHDRAAGVPWRLRLSGAGGQICRVS